MKQIIGAFGGLFVLTLIMFVCAGIIGASGQTAEAKNFKTDVIAEIENSNFNPNVIDGCISQASAAGYDLRVTSHMYDADNDIQTAEVRLRYTYTIPVLGIETNMSTRGTAR